jgi:hypothetical protein
MLRNQIAELVGGRALAPAGRSLASHSPSYHPLLCSLPPPRCVCISPPYDGLRERVVVVVCVCLSVCLLCAHRSFGDAQRIEAQHPKWLGVCIPGRRQSRRRRRRRKCRLRLARYPTTLGSDTFFQTSSVFGGRAGGGKVTQGSQHRKAVQLLYGISERETQEQGEATGASGRSKGGRERETGVNLYKSDAGGEVRGHRLAPSSSLEFTLA